MSEVRLPDADARFAARLGEEIRGVLGPAIELDGVTVMGEGPVSLIAACRVDGRRHDVVGEGATLLDASRSLIRAAAELRLTEAWSALEASQ
jgi:hypothetical protein